MEVVVLQIFAMVRTKGCQVCFGTELVSRSCAVVLIRGCEIYSLVPAKKFVEFMVCN